jgi:hypothetical protein
LACAFCSPRDIAARIGCLISFSAACWLRNKGRWVGIVSLVNIQDFDGHCEVS